MQIRRSLGINFTEPRSRISAGRRLNTHDFIPQAFVRAWGYETLPARVVHVVSLIEQDAHACLSGYENVTANVIAEEITA
jgi:hypothetical protein